MVGCVPYRFFCGQARARVARYPVTPGPAAGCTIHPVQVPEYLLLLLNIASKHSRFKCHSPWLNFFLGQAAGGDCLPPFRCLAQPQCAVSLSRPRPAFQFTRLFSSTLPPCLKRPAFSLSPYASSKKSFAKHVLGLRSSTCEVDSFVYLVA